MDKIIPRWEWRTFGPSFGPAEAHFAALEPTGVQESDELYLLSSAGDNVKVRDDLMDIKVFVETDAAGLEQWRPVLKASFPMSASDARRVAEALRVPDAELARDAYTLDQFLDEVAGDALRRVQVHKRRVRYRVGGCTSEVTDVVADGRPTRTIAIESEDAAAVVAAVRSVGLSASANTGYPKGLAALLDGAPQRFAVIDAGTNSVKFHVAERGPDGWHTVLDRAELTRLGEGLEEAGEISPAATERAIAAIGGMAEEARSLGAVAIAAVGTAGLRIATNGQQVVDEIAARTGVRIEIIPGDEESRLAFLAVGAALDLGDGTLAVFDTGGGSSQFTFGHGGVVDERFSVDVGAVRYTERFALDHAVSTAVLAEALDAIAADLARLDGRRRPDVLVGMGGAVTNMTAVMHELATYDPDVVQGSVLTRAELDRQIERYRTTDMEERRRIVGLQPKRADVILAGACIVRTILDRLGHDALTVSDRGLRHGVLVETFGAGREPAGGAPR